MKKYIFLDLDGTIFDFNYAERVSLIGMLEELGIEYDDSVPELYSEINDKHWHALERGQITRDEMLTHRFTELFALINATASPLDARRSYEGRLSDCYYYIDGAEELLCELSKKDYKLYLASNGTDSVQTRRIEASGIARYFDDIFISERIGHNKPSLLYFEECFKRIEGFDKSLAVIVGDSLSSDILGGKNANITTIWYNPCQISCGNIAPDYEIANLSELIPLLNKL